MGPAQKPRAKRWNLNRSMSQTATNWPKRKRSTDSSPYSFNSIEFFASLAPAGQVARLFPRICSDVYSLTRFRRSALETTETELSAMAAPAKTGDRSKPKTG